MELVCGFSKYPALGLVDDATPSFPDISARMFFDLEELLKSAAKKLQPRDRELFQESFLKVFALEGDLPWNNALGLDAACFSPECAAEITAAADAISASALVEVVSHHSKSAKFRAFGTGEELVELLREILNPFREAASKQFGVVIGTL